MLISIYPESGNEDLKTVSLSSIQRGHVCTALAKVLVDVFTVSGNRWPVGYARLYNI